MGEGSSPGTEAAELSAPAGTRQLAPATAFCERMCVVLFGAGASSAAEYSTTVLLSQEVETYALSQPWLILDLAPTGSIGESSATVSSRRRISSRRSTSTPLATPSVRPRETLSRLWSEALHARAGGGCKASGAENSSLPAGRLRSRLGRACLVQCVRRMWPSSDSVWFIKGRSVGLAGFDIPSVSALEEVTS
jgi:hypothetical protein